MYVYMYVSTHAYMYVCIYVSVYVCVDGCEKQGMHIEFLKGIIPENVHLTLYKQTVTLKGRNLKG